jgi:hypothetical protein
MNKFLGLEFTLEFNKIKIDNPFIIHYGFQAPPLGSAVPKFIPCHRYYGQDTPSTSNLGN